jgi:lysophospholipase L1-like esterase
VSRWIARALVGALGAAAAAVGAEAAARLALRDGGAYYRYRPHVRRRLDIDQSALPALDASSYVEINCDGERGGPPPRKGERAYRALVIGGSAAECYYLDQRQTWGAVAERILGRPEHLRTLGVDRVHIGNIARAILPCHELHQLMTRILPRYERLDAILIMVGASDVVSWLGEKMPATLREDPVPAGSIFEQHPDGPWSFSPRGTALWQLLSTQQRRLLRPLTVTPKSGDWLHRVRAMRARATQMIDECADPTPMLDRFEKWLRAIVALCASKAKRVVIVRQPWLGDTSSPDLEKMLWNFGVGRPYKEEVHVYCTPALASRLMGLADARAVRVAADLGVDQIDLMPVLEESSRTYYDFLHFTPYGAEVVGRVVAERLASPAPAAGAAARTPSAAP